MELEYTSIRQDISATWEKLIKPKYRAHLFHQVSYTKLFDVNVSVSDNAPVSKGFLGTVVVASFALNVPFQNYCRHLFLYSYSGIFEKYEVSPCVHSQLYSK